MHIAQSTTRTQFPLSPKKIIKKTILGSIVSIILMTIVYSFAGPIIAIITDSLTSSGPNVGMILGLSLIHI